MVRVEKISSRNVSEQVAEQIEQWIKKGEIKPKERLPSVRELCEQLNVGRSAVRDAMTTLKGKGLVDVRQGEGAFVSRFDPTALFQGILLTDEKDIRQLFNVRKILETGIAEEAARHRTSGNLDNMKQTVDQLKRSETTGDAGEADYLFHHVIAEATQNDMLVQLMETIASTTKKAMIDFHRIVFSDKKLVETVFQQHFAVFEAIRDSSPQKARGHMLDHLTFTEQLLQRYLKDPKAFASVKPGQRSEV